jgi:hypothetical protein
MAFLRSKKEIGAKRSARPATFQNKLFAGWQKGWEKKL